MTGDYSFTFLGTGGSVGVPVIGCPCPVCSSQDPKNQRLRSSALLQDGNFSILIDTGPDLRTQALREKFHHVDAILYTHAHSDHIAGFADANAFCWHRENPLPIYGTPLTLNALRQSFTWAFSQNSRHRAYVYIDPREILQPFSLGNFLITPLPVLHGNIETIGFLFEKPNFPKLAYIPDVVKIPEHTQNILQNIDILIVDALRPYPLPNHFGIQEATQAILHANAKQGILTHIGHELPYEEILTQLPTHIRPAHDGLRIHLSQNNFRLENHTYGH